MILQPRARAGIALIAAYALAMQALLLAVIASSATVAGTAALPICASAGAHPVPAGDGQAGGGQVGGGHAGHGQDCLDACLTGCCCGAPLQPLPPHALASPPKPLQTLARVEGSAAVPIRIAKAHRSRAPPVI